MKTVYPAGLKLNCQINECLRIWRVSQPQQCNLLNFWEAPFAAVGDASVCGSPDSVHLISRLGNPVAVLDTHGGHDLFVLGLYYCVAHGRIDTDKGIMPALSMYDLSMYKASV